MGNISKRYPFQWHALQSTPTLFTIFHYDVIVDKAHWGRRGHLHNQQPGQNVHHLPKSSTLQCLTAVEP